MNLETILAIAARHNNPETEIQVRDSRAINCLWDDSINDVDDMIQAATIEYLEYRIKPQAITLNGKELPKPIKSDEKFSVFFVYESWLISSLSDRFKFNSRADANAWAAALNELMGEGK